MSCTANIRGYTKCFDAGTSIPVRRCMAWTRSSGWTSVPPRKATFLSSPSVYSGSSLRFSGTGLSSPPPPCWGWPWPPGPCIGGAAYPLTVLGLSPSLLARMSSTHDLCSLFLALSRLVLIPTSSASFARRAETASTSTPPMTSLARLDTGTAWVMTRIRRSPWLLVYSSAACTVTAWLVRFCSSWTRSNAKVESALQFGKARRSFPRTKKLP